MTDSNPLDLDNLRAYARAALGRAEAATPGKWLQRDGGSFKDGHYHIDEYFVMRGQDDVAVCSDCVDPDTSKPSKANAAFIAAARLDVPNLAASVLTLAAKLEQAWAENAAHMLDVARLAEALDPLREIVAYGSVNNDPRLWTEVRD